MKRPLVTMSSQPHGNAHERYPLRLPFCPVLLGFALLLGAGLASSQTAEQGQIDFADGLFGRGFYSEAAEEYRAYLKQFPHGAHLPLASYRLGEAEHASRNFKAALDAFEELLKLDVDSELASRGKLGQGKSFYSLGRFEEAAKALSDLRSGGPPETIRGEALYYLGKAKYELGDMASSADAFTELIEGVPQSPLVPYARYHLAFAYLSAGEGEKAALEFSAVAAAEGVEDSLRMECRFKAAEAYDKIGWFDAAIAAYNQLRQDFPNSEFARRAFYGYGWSLYRAGKFKEAGEAARKFVEAHPDSAERAGTEYLRGNCLQQQERHDEALAIYAKIREAFPESSFALRAHYKTGWVLHFLGRLEEATDAVDSFLAAHKDSALYGDATFLRATIETESQQWEEASRNFALVAESYPASEFATEALFRWAESLTKLGRLREGAEIFERFTSNHPEHPLTKEAILRGADARFMSASFTKAAGHYEAALARGLEADDERKTLYALAVTYHNMQKYEKSASTFEDLLEKYAEGGHAAEAHLRIGDFLLREKSEAVQAIEAYEASLKIDTEGVFAGRALKGLALARYETKDYDGAAATFIRVMTEYPDVPLNEDSYVWVGQRLFDDKKYAQAVVAFERLLKENPSYPTPERVYFKIAESWEFEGKASDAIAYYDRVIAQSPKSALSASSKFRKAKLYEGLGDAEKARALYQEAADRNTGEVSARARFRLAELHEAAGEFQVAARHYMRVAILFLHQELSPESLFRAGDCFSKDGSPDQARRAFEEVIADFPESEQAAKAKTRLAELKGPPPVQANRSR